MFAYHHHDHIQSKTTSIPHYGYFNTRVTKQYNVFQRKMLVMTLANKQKEVYCKFYLNLQ